MNKTVFLSPIPLAIFGIPLDNMHLQMVVDRCLQAVQKGDQIHPPFHLAFLESPLIATCYGLLPTTVRDPQLLSIGRHANLSLASSGHLRRILRCLGSPLTEPVSVEQLIPALCQSLGKREKSIFFLGDSDKAAKKIAVKLHDDSRGLRLVGVVSAPIYTEGEDLVTAEERDTLLIEQINASRADVLIVDLESPKQELWFERVRRRLHVSLVCTLGGALKRTLKEETTQRHPLLKETLNNIVNAVKIVWMAIPLIAFHTINQALFQLLYKKKSSTQCLKDSQLFLSAHRSIVFISLPELIDASNISELKQRFDEASNHDVIVFDFLAVRHIQPEGFRLLIEAWLQRGEQQKEIYGFCPTSDIKCLMKVHRTWDLFRDSICDSANALMSRLSGRGELTGFYDAFMQHDDRVFVSILGALDNRTDYKAYLQRVAPMIGTKECIIDLRYCTSIDNSGFTFLLTLRKQLQLSHRHLALSSVNQTLRHQFKSAKVEYMLIQ